MQATQPWGLRRALVPLIAAACVVGVAWPLTALWHPRGAELTLVNAAILVVGYGVIGGVLWVAGAPIANERGGWQVFGATRPRATQLRLLPVAIVAETALRAVAVACVFFVMPSWRQKSFSNAHLRGHSVGFVTESLLFLVLIAPVVEEIVFRGFLLRTLMQHLSFWPAALISSAAFGVFHMYEVPTLPGAILLGVSTASFGLGQAILTRYTGSLGLPIAVHSVTNAVAAALNLF